MKIWVSITILALLQLGSAYAEPAISIEPEMVTVPAGTFMMGSPPDEPGRRINEEPLHPVTIAKPFAVGKYEVTFSEWDNCVADGGCNGYKPDDYGWGRGNRPVIYVSWEDAHAYIAWLNKKTGKKYRLLSEAEWEYSARAGAATAYYWGNDIGENNANCRECGGSYADKQTAPVGSFQPNAFGLYDMSGNVWEWTEDVYHNSYNGAPSDGSAWDDEKPTKGSALDDEKLTKRILRGGSWREDARDLRSAHRSRFISTVRRYGDIGFRLAETLP